MREILAVGNHPDRHDVGLTTRRPVEGSTDLEFETERAGLARHRVTRATKLKQGVAKGLPPEYLYRPALAVWEETHVLPAVERSMLATFRER